MSRDDQYIRELSDAELQDILLITHVTEDVIPYRDGGEAVRCRAYLIKSYVHRKARRALEGKEGVNWITGHHSEDNDEGKALLAAYALEGSR